MKPKFIMFLLFTMCVVTASAQWRVGVTGGATYNVFSMDKQYLDDYRIDGRWGVTLGVSGQYDINSWLAVYAHLPSMASYTLEKKLVEAEGIHPDIEVDLDIDQYNNTGKDTQLDRALQFIRTGQ